MAERKEMKRFKAISTITWQFESEEAYNEALKHAKEQLDLVLDSCPQGEEFAHEYRQAKGQEEVGQDR